MTRHAATLGNVDAVLDADVAATIERIYSRIYRFARFLLEPEPARDATASAIERMWRQRNRYRSNRGTLEAWLIVVGTNAVRDESRRLRRRPSTISMADIDVASNDDLDLRDRLVDLRAALELLKPGARELIALRHALDLSISDIAELTGRSPGATRVALHRALDELRKAVDEK